MSERSNVVIIGSGRLGALLAQDAHDSGWPTVVVDRDEGAFTRLSHGFGGHRVVGDATQMHTLREARVGQAAWLLTCCRNDNVNLLVAQAASAVLGVPNVIARVHDPARQRLYQALDVQTFSPTQLARLAVVALVGRP